MRENPPLMQHDDIIVVRNFVDEMRGPQHGDTLCDHRSGQDPLAPDATAIPALNQASACLCQLALEAVKDPVCLRGHMPDVSVRIGGLNATPGAGYPKIHAVGVRN